MSSGMRICIFVVVVVTVHSTIYGFRDRKYLQELFHCEPCELQDCIFPREACELVMETGICGCCPVCARLEGQLCGLTRGRCGAVFQCLPDPHEKQPLLALLQGRARCIRDNKINKYYE